jgi:RNA polymerase sigma-70 factor (ECF subfamily)
MIGPGADQQIVPRQAAPAHDLSSLARRAQAGGAADVEALLASVRVLAHRYSWARLGALAGAQHLVDDVVQDICIAVLRALPRYRDRGRPFEAFVHGVASRKVADAHRALARHPVPTDYLPDAVDDGPTPEDTAVHNSDVESASELLGELPKKLREVMVLRVGAGMSAEETAAVLDMTPGAVRVAQHRALARMRQALARRQGSHD